MQDLRSYCLEVGAFVPPPAVAVNPTTKERL